MEKAHIENNVIEVINSHCPYKNEKLDADKDLRDNYGIDSIILVEVLVELESVMNINFDSNLLAYDNFSTINKITDYIYELQNHSGNE